MYLAPDGDELEIATAAADFLSSAMPIERLHSVGSTDMDKTLRKQVGEMGWFALALPEVEGGSGLSAVEHALFFREVGRHCGALDVLTLCLAAMACDDPVLRAEIVAGDVSVALAVGDEGATRLLGSADAAYALSVGPEGAYRVPIAGIEADERASLDPSLSMRITREIATNQKLEDASRNGQIWQMGKLGTAAMLVGISEAALAQIVEYAKVRETFGRKIGSWQAVRHPCADMAVRVEAARSQLWFAATAMKEGRADAEIHLNAAKYLANQAAVANADSNIQLHGGIGVTDEHHAHLFLKHALVLTKLFGARRSLLRQLLHAGVED